ncbi:MAG: zinc finger MYND domain-containing protein [bacterium]
MTAVLNIKQMGVIFMKNIPKLVVLLLSTLCAISAQAVVYKTEVYQKTLLNGTVRKVTLFYDWHADYPDQRLGKQQQAAVLQQAKLSNAHILAEDMYTYDGNNTQIRDYFKKRKLDFQKVCDDWKTYSLREVIEKCRKRHICPVQPSGSFLHQIIKNGKEKNIRCSNVECRHSYTYSILSKEFLSQLNRSALSCSVVIDETQEIIKYFDDRLSLIKEENFVNPMKELLTERITGRFEKFRELIVDPLKSINDLGYDINSPILASFADHMVNFNILLKLFENEGDQDIFICAGASHFESIAQNLPGSFGYKLVYKEEAAPNFKLTYIPHLEEEGMRKIQSFSLQPLFDFLNVAIAKEEGKLLTDTCCEHKCLFCHELASLQCSQCKSVYYCSKKCQKQHWKTHKLVCKEPVH